MSLGFDYINKKKYKAACGKVGRGNRRIPGNLMSRLSVFRFQIFETCMLSGGTQRRTSLGARAKKLEMKLFLPQEWDLNLQADRQTLRVCATTVRIYIIIFKPYGLEDSVLYIRYKIYII